MLTLATAVITIGTSIAVVKDLRFWANRDDLVTVADVTYLTRIHQLNDQIIQLRIEARKCEEDQNCPDSIVAQFQRDIAVLEEEKKRYEREQAKID